ncbi:MAG: hypothetical protein KJ597_04370 [Nanoarchaeota archaeon]|nr:hypothetical protein [Nanoarchaeota archaeon]MBU1622783.1 hypothetical protein [Nanoarchaeota archaeon]
MAISDIVSTKVTDFIDYALVIVILMIIYYAIKFFIAAPPTKEERETVLEERRGSISKWFGKKKEEGTEKKKKEEDKKKAAETVAEKKKRVKKLEPVQGFFINCVDYLNEAIKDFEGSDFNQAVGNVRKAQKQGRHAWRELKEVSAGFSDEKQKRIMDIASAAQNNYLTAKNLVKEIKAFHPPMAVNNILNPLTELRNSYNALIKEVRK